MSRRHRRGSPGPARGRARRHRPLPSVRGRTRTRPRSERLATGRDETKRRSCRQEIGEWSGGIGEELLEVVEDDVDSLLADPCRNRSRGVAGAPRCPAIRGTTRPGSRTGARGTKTVPPSASSARKPGELDREARLARATGADDREDARLAIEPERRSLEQLSLAAEETGRGSRGDRGRPVSAAAGTPRCRAGTGAPAHRSPSADADRDRAAADPGREPLSSRR